MDRQAEREPDAEPRALTFRGGDAQRGPVAAHDAADRGHAESAPLISLVEKNGSNMRVMVWSFMPCAVVDDVDEHVAAGLDLGAERHLLSIARSSVSSPVSTVITSGIVDRFGGVDDQVEHDLADLCRVGFDAAAAARGCCRSACSAARPTRPASRPSP